jgi:hypothetical protein
MKHITLIALITAFACGQPTNHKPPAPKTEPTQTAPVSEPVKDPPQTEKTASTAAATNPKEEARPLYYEKLITQDELKGRSLRELSLMRNWIYARAGNTFRKKWLNDFFSAQPWYKPVAKPDLSTLTDYDKKNAALIAEYDIKFSKDELTKNRDTILARKKSGALTPEDTVELRLLSGRLGEWLGDTPEDARSPLEDISLLDKLLTVDQLQDLSRRDLRLVRNMIYARKNRPFKSQMLSEYFYAVLDNYSPDETYSDTRLSDIDNRNIKLIRSVEDEVGGPISDAEHIEESGWMSGA